MMRIGVRIKCQRQGIGRKLISFLLLRYPEGLSLDVNIENEKAIKFYEGIGMARREEYTVMERSSFIKFETPHSHFKIADKKQKSKDKQHQNRIHDGSSTTSRSSKSSN